jgi:hypothetical protein
MDNKPTEKTGVKGKIYHAKECMADDCYMRREPQTTNHKQQTINAFMEFFNHCI